MLTTNPFDDDKLREECGIFGIWGAESASSFVALGLHALQHRGQEAAGIVSFDGTNYHAHRAMGHVAGNFDRDDIIRKLSGQRRRSAMSAIRPPARPRCATSSRLFADLAEGGFAVAHNGNLSNAMTLARRADPPRLDLPVDQRYRSDHPPRRHLQLFDPARPADRRAEPGRGRLFAALPDARGPGRLPRSARHPPAGHGQARRGDHLRLRNRRARRDRRHATCAMSSRAS